MLCSLWGFSVHLNPLLATHDQPHALLCAWLQYYVVRCGPPVCESVKSSVGTAVWCSIINTVVLAAGPLGAAAPT